MPLCLFSKFRHHLCSSDYSAVAADSASSDSHNYHRKIVKVDRVPGNKLKDVKSWLSSCNMKYSEVNHFEESEFEKLYVDEKHETITLPISGALLTLHVSAFEYISQTMLHVAPQIPKSLVKYQHGHRISMTKLD
ncbi:hypothetical protein PV328_010476 [Microctonus aethiopoides]|uniref:Uncharacterized protein n=1 Tax=Microctonus aethiopoides TaxID=144406 RepID=A0AA39KQB3_9HYME|nr:hypothetical protein PV328_010476 [Microctonus aethiopoides]